MKIRKGLALHEICGANIIVAEGVQNIDFNNVIAMNETSVFLWKKVCDKEEFTIDELVDYLLEEYDVDENTARNDCEALMKTWNEAGILIE